MCLDYHKGLQDKILFVRPKMAVVPVFVNPKHGKTKTGAQLVTLLLITGHTIRLLAY